LLACPAFGMTAYSASSSRWAHAAVAVLMSPSRSNWPWTRSVGTREPVGRVDLQAVQEGGQDGDGLGAALPAVGLHHVLLCPRVIGHRLGRLSGERGPADLRLPLQRGDTERGGRGVPGAVLLVASARVRARTRPGSYCTRSWAMLAPRLRPTRISSSVGSASSSA
jgi:hypothetical protein